MDLSVLNFPFQLETFSTAMGRYIFFSEALNFKLILISLQSLTVI